MSQTPESAVLRACCEYLALRRVCFWRANNVPVFDRTRGSFRAMPAFSMKGVSDIIALKDSRAHFIEVKAAKGVLSPDQRRFDELVSANGALYHVVRSVDDLIAAGF